MVTLVAIVAGLLVAVALASALRGWRERGRLADYGRWAAAGMGGALAWVAVLRALGSGAPVAAGPRALPGGALGVALLVGAALGIAFGRGARLAGGWRDLERAPRRSRDG